MKHIKIFCLSVIVVASLSGCLKKDTAVIDPYSLSAPIYTLEWIQPGGTTVNSGLQYFAQGALLYPATHTADTTNFTVRLTGADVSDKDVPITIGQDSKALLDNFKSDSISYESMPDSLFKFVNTTATIKKGTSVASFQIIFYPSKINPTKNYMLAPTVMNPAGAQVSTNFGHVYFHTIGNIFAGAYKVTGTRYNYSGVVAWDNNLPVPPGNVGVTDLGAGSLGSRNAAPDNGKTFRIPFANVGAGYDYIITYDATTKKISVNYSFANLYSNFVTTVVSLVAPAPGVKASFHIITHYNNALAAGGNDRIIDETFTQK